jgi:hypothetical protein
MQRNLIVAFCFASIWASIQYTQGRITDLQVLAVNMAMFVVFGAALCWAVQYVIDWLKRHQK